MYKKSQYDTKSTPLKRIFDFYIFSNIHVALATFCLVKITLVSIGISENNTAWFVFFSTLLSYNIIRFLRLETIKSWYYIWISKNKKALYFLSLLSFFWLIYFSFQLRLKAILVLIPFTMATTFYVFPIKKLSLRNVAGLKLFLIAFSWAGITVIFPLIQNYMTLQNSDWITFFQRFLFVIVITIPFDIRDVDYDSDTLKTLPQQFGISKTKIIGLLLLCIFFILEFFKTETSYITNTIIAILSAISLVKSTKKQSKYYSAFFVEALPIVWYLLVIYQIST